MTLEGSKRILTAPVKRKEPVTVDMLRNIINLYISILVKFEFEISQTMHFIYIRFFRCCFFRYSELADIYINGLQICEGHIQINIKRSKTEQYRQGQNIIIAKTGSDLLPVFWLNK